ncbi:MAG TPA: FAD-dependent tricarballylate dehydrogenase TcuA [Candidatus Limnocylindria bacterium]|nr:FAD-dependent tricarballylate dehydrogenase TcuA [Candidatus Limnocylindria bacterium]
MIHPSQPEIERLRGSVWDVVVAGGGNAGLVAALSARERGARVLLLERAPRHMRAGNTRHTRNIRCAHDAADAYYTGPYSVDELLEDLKSVGRPVNLDLACFAVQESRTIPQWMTAHGVKWQRALRGTLNLGRTNRFFLGGGTALMNHYYRMAEIEGVEIVYQATVADVVLDGRRAREVVVRTPDGPVALACNAVVIASGGFEANIDWLKRYWGDAADNYLIRGTPYNDGLILARLIELGAATAGDPKGFHAIGIDARSPKFDGGIATRSDAIPYSIVVNRDGRRFADEGQDLWPKRYASWGRLIAEQPGQLAYAIYDSRVKDLFIPSMYRAFEAGSIAGIAEALGLDPVSLQSTVEQFNVAVSDDRAFDPTKLDGRRTDGITPPKSNWAVRIERPPLFALPLRPGITFTYMGLAVNEHAKVAMAGGGEFDNVYAAGEVMSGNILSSGYLAGFGLTIGHVFGRIAGREAAGHAAG